MKTVGGEGREFSRNGKLRIRLLLFTFTLLIRKGGNHRADIK